MKKILLSLLCFISFTSYSQVDFFKLIDNIKWNSTENDIVKEYSTIIKRTKHTYDQSDKTENNWVIENVILGNYTFTVSFEIDSVSKKLHSLRFGLPIEVTEKENPKQLSKNIELALSNKLGLPDSKTDENNTVFPTYDRVWYKDVYIINIVHADLSRKKSYSSLYSITVKGVVTGQSDFREARWGDSKEKIIAQEGKPDKLGINELYVTKDFIAGMNCDVAYIFTENKFTMAKYIFRLEHTNKNSYIDDFNKIVSLMSEKYGQPGWNTPRWENNLYKNDSNKYGFAISLGHLVYSAGWLNDKTDISVLLRGENYKIELSVQYKSKKYEEIQKRQELNKDIKKF